MSGTVQDVGPDGLTPQNVGYNLAAPGQSLAVGASTTPVTGIEKNAYAIEVQANFGSGGSLSVCTYAADGSTVMVLKTGITTSGVQPDTYQCEANSTLFLRNDGTTALTQLYATAG